MKRASYVTSWLAASTVAPFVVAPIAHADGAAIQATTQGADAILMRHATISAHGMTMILDASGTGANEENLGDAGRAQSQRLQAMLDKGGVTFDAVLTGPFCRAKERAQLAFGKATVDQNLTLASRVELGMRPRVAASSALEVPVEVRM